MRFLTSAGTFVRRADCTMILGYRNVTQSLMFAPCHKMRQVSPLNRNCPTQQLLGGHQWLIPTGRPRSTLGSFQWKYHGSAGHAAQVDSLHRHEANCICAFSTVTLLQRSPPDMHGLSCLPAGNSLTASQGAHLDSKVGRVHALPISRSTARVTTRAGIADKISDPIVRLAIKVGRGAAHCAYIF